MAAEDEGVDEEVEDNELGAEGNVDETVGAGDVGEVLAAPATPLPAVIVTKTFIPAAPSVPTEVAQLEDPQPICVYPIGYVLV